MKKKILLSLALLLATHFGFSQAILNRDPTVESMVKGVSPEYILSDITALTKFHSRHNLTPKNDPKKGVWAASEWAKQELEKNIPASGGRLSVELLSYKGGGAGQRIAKETELPVVMATLKGTDPTDDRVILVSAHIDSRVADNNDFTTYAPGANDDGSGVAAIMEMVRTMSSHPFSATIRFMLVSGEEHGLMGARYIAETAKKENWNIIAMLNNDMIGNAYSSDTKIADNTRLRVFSEGIPAVETEKEKRERIMSSAENDSKSRQLARYAKEIGERYVDQLEVVLIYRNDRFGRGGDHTPFLQNGFTAVRFTEFNENYDRTHKNIETKNGVRYGDEIEGVDIEYVRKNTGVNIAVAANLALAPYAPQKVKMDIRGLSNRTQLSWEKPTQGKAPAGYYVLIRETSSAVWQKKVFVTETAITLPYSKDNYHFAVQSVDAQGHESLPVYPGVL